jgi:hypothetical protein
MGGSFACIDPAVIRRACACRSERRLAIWLTDGFVGSVWRARCLIPPRFRRTAKVAFVTATLPARSRVIPLECVDRNQRRLQRLCFLRIAWAVPRNGETAWHLNEPPAVPGKEWGKASAAQLNRNLNYAHKIWL